VRYLHGTHPDTAEKVLADGFDVEVPRRSDPGDFGWGVYLTSKLSRAKSYGSTILEVEIDEVQFVRMTNPYFLDGLKSVEPSTFAEKLFHRIAFDGDTMLTVKDPPPAKPGFPEPKSRVEVCKEIAQQFTIRGVAGIIAGPFPGRRIRGRGIPPRPWRDLSGES